MIRALFLLLFSVNVFAASDLVSVDLQQVPLNALVRLVYADIAPAPYVVSHQATMADSVVSLSLKNVKRTQVLSAFLELLNSSGFSATDKGGVVFIDKSKDDFSEFYYRPRFRSVSYLVDLLSPVFKQGAFGSQRGMQSGMFNTQPGMIQGMQPTPQNNQTQAKQNQPMPMDSGTSAYSQMDKNPDALMFKGTPAEIERVKKLLAQVDIVTPELLVKAVVYEVTTTSTDKSALALAMAILGGKLQLGKVIPGDYSGVFKVGSLDIVFDALSTDSRFKVVSSPTLRVKSGSSARLNVGNQTPVLGATTLSGNGTTTQSVEYKPSGVILDLKPDVREDVADLKIDQQISNFVRTTTGVNNTPTLVTRELTTTVGVRPDDVLILGGLDEDKSSNDRTGLSFMPDWMRPKGSSTDKTEILIILQATRI